MIGRPRPRCAFPCPCSQSAYLLLLVLVLACPVPGTAEMQRNVSPDGHETALAFCRPATIAEAADPAIAPDGWVQDEPRASYSRGIVPLPLVPDWVGTLRRAVGALAWFDADHDGDQDLFTGTYFANQYPPLDDYYNFIYLNAGGVLEATPSWRSDDQKHTGDAALGSIDGDVYPDLFLATGGTGLQGCQVFYGRDGLLPTAAGWNGTTGSWATGCSLADFDLDGDLDAATSNQGVSPNPYRPTTIYRNLGTVLETSPSWQSNQVGITSECGWADVDGDHDLDLAVGGSGYPDWLFANEGTLLGDVPVWASGEPYTGCQDLAWADIDRDGDLDLASIHFSTGHVRIYLNEAGVLPATADWQYDAVSNGSAIAFGDVNGDGWLDLAIGWRTARSRCS